MITDKDLKKAKAVLTFRNSIRAAKRALAHIPPQPRAEIRDLMEIYCGGWQDILDGIEKAIEEWNQGGRA